MKEISREALVFVSCDQVTREEKRLGATVFQMISELTSQYLRSIDTCMPVWYYVTMKRTALFLKEEQLKKLLALSKKTGAPVSELIRRAIDKYLLERAKELK
jgi:hypothetical protein